MWALRILNGPQAGKKITLRAGENMIGRSATCTIQLQSQGVSKNHAKIIMQGQQLFLQDMGSSNGTFVNGVRVREHALRAGDKIGFHDLLVDIVPEHTQHFQPPPQQHAPPPPQQFAQDVVIPATPKGYVESVLMPGIYQLTNMFEFRYLLGVFVLAFVVTVTALSTIPMLQITKSTAQKESQRRALSIARNLVNINQAALQQGLLTSITTQFAEREEGVKAALIVSSKDGHIMAPASKAGGYSDQPFVNSARKEEQETVKQISDDLVGASVPIRAYQPETGAFNVVASAIVVYNMGSLAIDDGRTISLFIQTLGMALVIGFILYFFMIRMIEHPLEELNLQIDSSLKDGTEIRTAVQFPQLQALIVNINSALARASGGSGGGSSSTFGSRAYEAENIIRIIQNPAVAIDTQMRIISTNEALDRLLGLSSVQLKGATMDQLSDQALILNLQDLMAQNSKSPDMIATGHLEFSGVSMELDSQAVQSPQGIEYYLISIKQAGA